MIPCALRVRSFRAAPLALAAVLLAAALPLAPGAGALFDGRFGGYELTEVAYALIALDNPTSVVLPDDDMTEALDLGFSARLFDDPVTQFWVGSNGFISLFKKELDGCCEGQALPDPSDPDGLVAGFWTDLDPGAGGTIQFQQFAALARPGLPVMKGIAVQWTDVPGPGGALNTFQIAFLEDGTADIVITEAHALGTPATIGAENFNGSRGVTVAHGDALDLAQVAWRLAPIYVPLVPDLLLQSVTVDRPLQPDAPWKITVAVQNVGTGPLTQGRIRLVATPEPGPLRGTSPGCPELVGSKAIFDLKEEGAAQVQFAWPAPLSPSAPSVPRIGAFRFDAQGEVLIAVKPEENLANNAASAVASWLAEDLGGSDPFCQALPAPLASTLPISGVSP